MDDFRFYVLLNSFSVMSGRCHSARLFAMDAAADLRLRLQSGPEVIKLFPCSAQLSMKF